jgi:hypothetical protein
MDGASQTDTGRKTKAPDLRAPATQSKSDNELTASITAGHKGMPSFRAQADAARVRQFVTYIRSLKK